MCVRVHVGVCGVARSLLVTTPPGLGAERLRLRSVALNYVPTARASGDESTVLSGLNDELSWIGEQSVSLVGTEVRKLTTFVSLESAHFVSVYTKVCVLQLLNFPRSCCSFSEPFQAHSVSHSRCSTLCGIGI